MNAFEYTFPQWESWLDGQTHEIPAPFTDPKQMQRFRGALRSRCQRRLLNLSVRTVWRQSEQGYERFTRIRAW